MTTLRTTVTPQQAAEMLLKNSCNRPLRQQRITAYAHDMKRGAFDGRAVHIYVGENGELLNGQHTLSAIVASGVPLEGVLVETDVPMSVMDHLDRGLSRNLRDALTFRGAQSVTNLGAILRGYLLLRDRRDEIWGGLKNPTQSDCLRLYETSTDLFDRATSTYQSAASACKISAQYGVLAAYVDGLDSPEWRHFHAGVTTGENLVKGDPRLTLRNWIQTQSPRYGGSTQQQYRMVCITRAWNAWVRDENLVMLKWPARSLPMPEPIRIDEVGRGVLSA